MCGFRRLEAAFASRELEAARNDDPHGDGFRKREVPSYELRETSHISLLQLAESYLDLAFLPLEMRALVGEDIKILNSQSAQHVSLATRFF